MSTRKVFLSAVTQTRKNRLSTKSGVMAAAAMAKENKCDFLIGLGGGSSVDIAKATAIMIRNDGDLWD